MKTIKYFLSTLIIVFILYHAAPAYAAMTPVGTPYKITDTVLYDVNNSTTKNLSDYAGTSKVIILGRAVNCYNTDKTIKNMEGLAKGLDASKTTIIFGDYDDSVTNTKSYTDVHNIIMCASPTQNYYYAIYAWNQYSACISPKTSSTILLPLVLVVDKNGYVRYYSNGTASSSDIFNALKVINSDITFDDDKACTTEVAKSNLAKHKLYRTDNLALSYYKEVYDQVYYTNSAEASIASTASNINMGTSAVEMGTGKQINVSSSIVSQEDRVKAIKALSITITSGKTTDYDKVLAIHDWVCDNIYYDYMYYYGYTASTNLSAYDVMTNKTTVCEGYANLTTMLIRAAGIPCKKIIGYGLNYGSWPTNVISDNPSNHAWNEAYLNGKWTIIDNTWDSGNTYNNNVLTKGTTRYSYLDPFIAIFSTDHYIAKYEEDLIANEAPVISVKSTGGSFVELTWKEIDNAYGYDIYRAPGESDNYEKIFTTYGYLFSGTVIYKDTSCSANTQYNYKVIPYCKAGTTPFYGLTSNLLAAKTTLQEQLITATTNYTKKLGDATFSLNASTTGDGQLTYFSADTKIVSVDDTGKVTILGAGTTKITITAQATALFAQKTFVVTVVVNQGTQSIYYSSYFAKTYGDNDFYLGATGTIGGGALSYTSDNTSIVTVSSTGLVTIKGGGFAKVTITAAANTNYPAVSVKVYINVSKLAQVISIPSSSYTKTYGNAAFSLPVTRTGDGQLTYTSNNKNVVTVDATGKVTILGAGSAIITITANETATHLKEIKTISVTVNKASQTITAPFSYTKTYGNSAFSLGATVTKGGSNLSYTTSNSSVVTVSSTGLVTIKGCGKAVITITANANSNYNKATKMVLITINPKKAKVTSLVSTITTKMTLSWEADTSTSGYEIVYSTDKNFVSNKIAIAPNNKTTSMVITGLQKGKVYYVKIRAFKVINGVKLYGEYSTVKYVKVK